MKFRGVDLHSNNRFVVIIDEADRIMYRRRLPNELSGILAAPAPHRDELAGVVVESTYKWYRLVDPWQCRGVGRIVLARLLALARRGGYTFMSAVALASNSMMVNLARSFGFEIYSEPGGTTTMRRS